MAVPGKDVGESYEHFESSEFEEPSPAVEKKEEKAAEAKGEKEGEDGDDRKLTPEEAFTEDGDGDKAADAEVEADDKSTEKDPAKVGAEGGATDGDPAYEPNHKYTAYGQEKEFPELLKGLVKDKESEDYFRDLLSKADGLDEMKPRHQEAVRERDEAKAAVEFYKTDINRILDLRDKHPHLFAAELNLSDDWIIKFAKEIVNARDTPEARAAFDESRRRSVESYAQHIDAGRTRQAAAEQFNNVHQQQMVMALSHPDVSSFQSRFDAIHGLGSFLEEVRKHGSHHFEQTQRTKGRGENLPAMDAVKAVVEFHKKTMSPQLHVEAESKESKTKAPATRVAPKPIPSVGKGRNASPVGQPRFKNLKEMRAFVDKNIGR